MDSGTMRNPFEIDHMRRVIRRSVTGDVVIAVCFEIGPGCPPAQLRSTG